MNEGIYRYEDRIYIVLEYDTFVCSNNVCYIYRLCMVVNERRYVRLFRSLLLLRNLIFYIESLGVTTHESDHKPII